MIGRTDWDAAPDCHRPGGANIGEPKTLFPRYTRETTTEGMHPGYSPRGISMTLPTIGDERFRALLYNICVQ